MDPFHHGRHYLTPLTLSIRRRIYPQRILLHLWPRYTRCCWSCSLLLILLQICETIKEVLRPRNVFEQRNFITYLNLKLKAIEKKYSPGWTAKSQPTFSDGKERSSGASPADEQALENGNPRKRNYESFKEDQHSFDEHISSQWFPFGALSQASPPHSVLPVAKCL